MKRFLIVLALVAVAGSTYVATAPGSQTAAPTAKQFKALAKEVKGLKKRVGQVQRVSYLIVGLLSDCMAVSVPITQRGDWQNAPNPTFGYSYSDPSINSGTPFPETALDATTPDDDTALWITGGDSSCGTDLDAALHKLSRVTGIQLHHVSPQSFSVRRP